MSTSSNAERLLKFKARHAAIFKERHKQLTEHMNDVPRVRKLTEDDWLDLCKYFGGCALCGSDEIEVRHLMTPPSEGGKYAKGNIIPLCSFCKRNVDDYGPFETFSYTVYKRVKLKVSRLRLHEILDYYYNVLGEEYDKYDSPRDDELCRRNRESFQVHRATSGSCDNFPRLSQNLRYGI